MMEPSRTALYALIAAFVVLVILSLLVGGILSFLIYVVMLAIVVYFVLVAVRERARARDRVSAKGDETDGESDSRA